MKKARVLVTSDCSHACINCWHKDDVFQQKVICENINDLLLYDEILIVGGEPMLYYDKVIKFCELLRNKGGYKGDIYLYSSAFSKDALNLLYMHNLFELIDGMQYTLHSDATDSDVSALKQLSRMLRLIPLTHSKSLRLAIDDRLYNDYDFSNIDFSSWSVVRKMRWLKNAPLPDGEVLLDFCEAFASL